MSTVPQVGSPEQEWLRGPPGLHSVCVTDPGRCCLHLGIAFVQIPESLMQGDDAYLSQVTGD